MSSANNSLGRSAGLISLASTLSRITGLLSILIIGNIIGYNRLHDSYNLANVMPNMLFELIAGGILTSVFIPIFIEQKLKDENEAFKAASNITNIFLLFLIIIAIIGSYFSYYLVRLQTFLVPTKQVSVATLDFFFKFFIWEIVFYGLTIILNGVLQSYKKFAAPAFAPIFNNLVTIATVIFFYLPFRESNPHLALINLAVGTTLGVAAMAAVQLPAFFKLGFKYYPIINFKDETVKKLGLMSLPVLGYVLANQIGLTITNALAWKFNGGMTAFTVGWRFFQAPYGLFAVSISTVIFPKLSELASKKDYSSLKEALSFAVQITAFIIIPLSIALVVLSKNIVALLFSGQVSHFFAGRVWSPAAISQTATLMAFFFIGLLPFSIYMLLTRVFYALQDTTTPMMVNALGVPLNVVLNFLLVSIFNVAGLSLAHSLTYLFTMLLLFLALRKKIGALAGRRMLKRTAQVFALSLPIWVIIGLVMFVFKQFLVDSSLFNILVITLGFSLSGLFYLAVSRYFSSQEAAFVGEMIRGVIPKPELKQEVK